ncbi:uncharacterized protein LOC126778125 [Nymphalis io]|uniref:uncharacterized protein LOC126778125 n=1 Tax=Inachis io TaxID=171585 RepID=UPI00216932E6|nr:uncharacterized protein LOC126778125 [Nymphalis io]
MLANSTKKKALILTLILLHARCSRVIDKHQEAIYMSDYCPKIGECVEGSHVMCTHYNPKSEMGPLCVGTEKVSITDEYAEILLDLMNSIRSKAANGLVIGYERQKLPRGYGIFRLQWDPELATFAQLWANQCIIDNDICRATKKFADPGQLLVLTMFSEPDWLLIGKRTYFNETGFNMKKLRYCLFGSIRSWYTTKKQIDADIILGRKWSTNLLKNPYLQLVQGSATHVGCGISVFKSFFYSSEDNDLLFNLVRLVCNFSTRIREGQIYSTDPPTEVGYTVKCGCPLGYDEDADCLCYESGRGLPFSCKYGQCKPHVVVLPIITVEDAPPHTLLDHSSRQESNTELTKRNKFDRNNGTYSKRHVRPSLFSKSSIFKLPTRKFIKSPEFMDKEDILPFKNLTNVIQDRRFYNQQNYNTGNKRTNFYRQRFRESLQNYKDKNIHDAENFNWLTRRNNTYSSIINLPVKYLDGKSNKKRDDKVMDLLNKLEQEAKHIQIDETKKDIFNQKLQNIYKTFQEKIKFSQNKMVNRNINIHDHETDNLNEYEDQIKSIKGNDNIIEPTIIDNDMNYNLGSEDIISRSNKVNDNNSIGIRNTFNIKEITRNNDLDNIMESYSIDEVLLNLDRRKYYQNKLNNLERKIHNLRNLNNRRVYPYNNYYN